MRHHLPTMTRALCSWLPPWRTPWAPHLQHELVNIDSLSVGRVFAAAQNGDRTSAVCELPDSFRIDMRQRLWYWW